MTRLETLPRARLIDAILRSVAQDFDLTVADLACDGHRSSSKAYSQPRYVAIYLLRELARMPLNEIQRWLEYADHRAVARAVACVRDRRRRDPAFAARLDALALRCASSPPRAIAEAA